MKRSTIILAAAAVLLLAGAARAQDFSFGFEGCPSGTVFGAPGEVRTAEVFCTLTTTNNPAADGAQGWSLSVAADGATIRAITVKGVKVSTIFDDDGDPSTPLVDPFELDLFGAGFKVTQPATLPGDPTVTGAVSAVVLHQTQKMVLHPTGTVQMAKLTIEYAIPEAGCTPVTLRYLDGLKGLGQPVNNVATFDGASKKPSLGVCTFNACVPEPGFSFALVGAGKPSAESGDNVLEQNVPITTGNTADVIVPVDVLLSSSKLSGPDGAQGWSVSIKNDPCMAVDSVTVKGVKVSTIFDDDGDPSTPLVDPFELDLFGAGFKVTQAATLPADPTVKGVVSAVVLHQTQKMVLHPNTTDTILRINYKVNVTVGQTTNCSVSFLDGLKGLGQPVANVITFGGASKKPQQAQGLVLKLTGTAPPSSSNFSRGDPNDDGKIDIGDAVYIVQAVVPGLGGPPVTCPDSGDANDDNRLDLPDAIYLINYQFKAGPAPAEPRNCGKDAGTSTTSCPPDSTNCP